MKAPRRDRLQPPDDLARIVDGPRVTDASREDGAQILHLAEEIVWIVRNQSRPCVSCGHKIPLKPFRLSVHCPHCGKVE